MQALLARRNIVAVGIIVFAILPTFANAYIVFVANLALMYILLSVGLNMLLGYAGQLAFPNAALFGVGAYTSGLLRLEFDLPYWITLPAGAAFATLIGLAIALPALRLRGLSSARNHRLCPSRPLGFWPLELGHLWRSRL